jgi:hypothetical protein
MEKLPVAYGQFAMVIPNVYTPEECKAWIADIESHELTSAAIRVDGAQVVDSSVRRCKRWMDDNVERTNDLWKRIRAYVEMYEAEDAFAVGLNPRLRCLKYEPGDYFMPHYDDSHDMGDEFSLLSAIVYLNDTFEGGETVFLDENVPKDKVVHRPQQGSVLLMEQSILHEGVTPTSGIKYIVRTDVMFTESESC